MENTSTNIVLIVVCIVLLAVFTAWGNSFKQSKCEREGGRFIKNISDSTQSTCIMGQ